MEHHWMRTPASSTIQTYRPSINTIQQSFDSIPQTDIRHLQGHHRASSLHRFTTRFQSHDDITTRLPHDLASAFGRTSRQILCSRLTEIVLYSRHLRYHPHHLAMVQNHEVRRSSKALK
ncbi:hypothetical protein TNCV_638111 [Trichonephila clavipes]|nr:hypothetical protein TNCV_638111 [Trichonephila clavipes]